MERSVRFEVVVMKNNKHFYYCESRGTTDEVVVMMTEEQPQVSYKKIYVNMFINAASDKTKKTKLERMVPVLASEEKVNKVKQIRHAEYYDLIKTFDTLYEKSKAGKIFNKLIDFVISDENIKLAYRNIKKNKGSHTKGSDASDIETLAKLTDTEFVDIVRSKLEYYRPQAVRRVEIPKPDGKIRPLGIPTIWDRIIQQCVLQVLEPICEAKFYKYSYGFRPNRSAENAIRHCYNRAQICKLFYVVDIDIKGFFDNVNHSKLCKQLWTMGIRDKKLLCIIKAMLRAPIILPNGNIIYPTKGTPQGGILSPLLSNVVLNELDWWIANQWENFPNLKNVKLGTNKKGVINLGAKYKWMRKCNLKEIYIVRYADDFKIFCRTSNTANKIFHATKQWLTERLKLEVSPEK